MKTLINILITHLVLMLSINNANSETKQTVNVLTWWGYLDDPSTSKLIEQKCGATLSYDNYTSNDDMLRRWTANANKYDLLVFSDTIYNAVKDKIFLNKSELWKNAKNYNPTIRKKYENSHFSHNIAYFLHSLTGFIWNPTVQTSFKKAQNNKVILLDDPVEINMLLAAAINNNFSNRDDVLSLANFKKLTQNAKIYVSNEINKIYGQKDFAFSYQWSGDAFSRNLNIKNYHFLINEHLSYVSTDLIAQVKDNAIAACAADVLASKQFLSRLQNKSLYFSPYGNIDTVPDGEYKEAYKSFLINLPKLHWLDPPSSIQLKKLNQEWDKVKYELLQDRE